MLKSCLRGYVCHLLLDALIRRIERQAKRGQSFGSICTCAIARINILRALSVKITPLAVHGLTVCKDIIFVQSVRQERLDMVRMQYEVQMDST